MGRRLIALGATAALMALAACSGGDDPGTSDDATGGEATSGSAGGALTLGEISFPASFDVNGYSIAHYVGYFNAVYDTLIRQDGEGNLIPGLATEWEYDDTRTELTLTLREGITFTDGVAFDAEAVVANIENFQASATPDLSNAQYISDVTAVSDTEVVISLSAPDPMLTTWFTGSLGFQASPDSFDNPDVATNPVGTGPYTLDVDRTVVGSSYVYQRNPNYWDDSYHVYDTLTINYYETQTALLNALQGGQLDAATFSDVGSLPQVEGAGYEVVSSQLDWTGLIIFDRDGTVDEALGDVRVRQAINHAIDREGILEAIQLGYGTATSQVFGEATDGYLPELDEYYDYDPDAARTLLAEAGYGDGLELEMPSSSLIDSSLLATIQQQLSDVGISVGYTDVGSNFITDLLGGKFTSSWMQLASANDWQFAQLALVPNATFNPLGTEDDVTNGYIEIMQSGTDEEAAAAAQDFNRHVTEEAWFAPFYRVDTFWVAKPSVSITMAADNVSPYLYQIQPAS